MSSWILEVSEPINGLEVGARPVRMQSFKNKLQVMLLKNLTLPDTHNRLCSCTIQCRAAKGMFTQVVYN